ncbi:hypothetical protein ACN47E_005344 [Coniothyrium glycines]
MTLQPTPGSFVGYHATGTKLPAWPAVVCTDDVATEDTLRLRPYGYTTLVLLMGVCLRFRWAKTSELLDYNPELFSEGEDEVPLDADLGIAYACAESARLANLGLDHWRREVRKKPAIIDLDDEDSLQEFGHESDPVMRRAQQESYELHYGKRLAKKAAPLTRSSSPPRQLHKRNLAKFEDFQEESFSNSRVINSSRFTIRQKPPRSLPLQWREDVIDLAGSSDDELYETSPPLRQSKFLPFTQMTKETSINPWEVGRSSRTAQHSSSSADDIVEGELNESKQCVIVRVGPDAVERLFLKKSIWNRPYFQEPTHSIMYFHLNENDLYELRHPELAEIDPDDFEFAAEFIESGSFGIKNAETPQDDREAFAEIASAWDVAHKLRMTDLQDHCVEKIEGLASLDMWDCMGFACCIYDSSGVDNDAQTRLKALLSTQIAENFFFYLKDKDLAKVFIEMFQQRPELRRHVYEKLLAMLDREEDAISEKEDEEMED